MVEVDRMEHSFEDIAQDVSHGIDMLRRAGRYDLLFGAIGGTLLEELKMEQARALLSRLVITRDYRFLLPSYGVEVDLSPVHKAVYMLFLNHPEGIEFKRLSNYRDELYHLYKETANRMDMSKMEESVDRLVNPFDNAINEKCSRIKKAFLTVMDEYRASYYIISSHARQPVSGSSKTWYRRIKVINLPRELVVYE